MASFQVRLKKCMKRRNMRTADVARWFNRPYTTVREWVKHGRQPDGTEKDRRVVERRLVTLEKT
jgi:hypothetical protein